jgi:uncharacterized membrane protein YuzA (DUF378 family)
VISRDEEEVMATMNIPTDRRHIPERRTTQGGERHGVKMSVLDYIAMALLIIGGLNWAMVALFGVDVVATLFGVMSAATRVIYLLVGVAALYSIYLASKMAASRT